MSSPTFVEKAKWVPFLIAAADWAETNAAVIRFERENENDWFAVLPMRDGRGEYTVIVDAVVPRRKSPKREGETRDEFEQRVGAAIKKETLAASRKRGNKVICRAKLSEADIKKMLARSRAVVSDIDQRRAA